MNIHVLFMQRKESYPEEFGPEVVAAIDEFVIEENPSCWTEVVEQAKASQAAHAAGFAEVVIQVDQAEIRRRCLGQHPPLKGTIRD